MNNQLCDTGESEFRQRVRTYEKLVRELNEAARSVDENGGYTWEEVMAKIKDSERKSNA